MKFLIYLSNSIASSPVGGPVSNCATRHRERGVAILASLISFERRSVMNAFMRQFLVIIAVLVATANACNAVADGFRDGGRIGLSSEVADRDKTGTSPALKKEPGSQVLEC